MASGVNVSYQQTFYFSPQSNAIHDNMIELDLNLIFKCTW